MGKENEGLVCLKRKRGEYMATVRCELYTWHLLSYAPPLKMCNCPFKPS